MIPPTIRLGSEGEHVRTWQTILGLEATGDFDEITEAATKVWQHRADLKVDGVVGPKTWGAAGHRSDTVPEMAAVEPGRILLPDIKFVRAKHWRWVNRGTVELVVMHSAETAERPDTAEALANYVSHIDRTASWHYSVDCDSIVQHIEEKHKGIHVRAGEVNDRSVGIEMAGRARQSREEWLDDYGRRMLPIAAALVARICARWDIPVAWLTPEQLKEGRRGIVGHRDVRDAFGVDTHWDPGEGFPKDVFIDLVKENA